MFEMNYGRALAGMHVAALMFGLTGVFGKLTEAGPLAVVLGRALFAVLSLMLFARVLRAQMLRGISFQQFRHLALCGVMLGIHWLTFFHAVNVSGVGIATLGFASFPAFVVLLEAIFWRELPSRLELTKVGLVCCGLVLVTPNFSLGDQATAGLLWAILSGFCFAAVSVGNRLTAGKLNALQVAGWQNLVIVVCLLPLASAELVSMSGLDWLWVALLGVLCTGLAHGLFVASLSVLKARVAALFFALEPVYGILFAWILFAEQPGLRMILGGALIVAALVLRRRGEA